MQTTAFVSWSGGKDCTLALYTFLQNPENRISHIVNIVGRSEETNTHHLGSDLLIAQSRALGIPLIRERVEPDRSYEFQLKKIISKLKPQGITAGIFGDIHLREHRQWIERVCRDMEITALFPLWGRNTEGILEEFVNNNFRAIVIATQNTPDLSPLLGKELDNELIEALIQIQGIDLCGEHGEYHSFVFDGPIFKKPVCFTPSSSALCVDNNSIYLPLKTQNNHGV